MPVWCQSWHLHQQQDQTANKATFCRRANLAATKVKHNTSLPVVVGAVFKCKYTLHRVQQYDNSSTTTTDPRTKRVLGKLKISLSLSLSSSVEARLVRWWHSFTRTGALARPVQWWQCQCVCLAEKDDEERPRKRAQTIESIFYFRLDDHFASRLMKQAQSYIGEKERKRRKIAKQSKPRQ